MAQAAGGYVTYDEKTRTFSLNEEQAFALANEDSPAYIPGALQLALGSLAAVPRFAESFRSGAWMIVEPFANDELKDNLNPVGRDAYYSFSTLSPETPQPRLFKPPELGSPGIQAWRLSI
jgi:hypothetical protein